VDLTTSGRPAGAKEFKQHFEEAMAHNEKLLAADEASGETPDQDAAEEQHKAKAAEEDDLAGKVEAVKVADSDDKSSQA
jgi:hypothetical protein